MTARHPAEILFSSKHPLTSSLDMKFLGVENGTLKVTVTAPNSFGDADGINVHTGFLTLFMDTVMGSCAIGSMDEFQPLATIKLTCNHIRRPRVGEKLMCLATCDSIVDSVIYIRGKIVADINGETDDIVSHAVGTFMAGTRSRPLEEKS